MQKSNLSENRRHLIQMVALFFLLCCVYLLTYNGEINFNDEMQMLDTVGSIVDYGDDRYDLALWYVWTNYGPLGQNPEAIYPLPASPIEPVHILVATPLYWLAANVPGLGIAHTVLLLNILVAAAACVLMAQYALLLGYDRRVGILAALCLGLLTTLWPYTRTFLREPLTLFLVLLAAYFFELARQRKSWLYGMLGSVVVVVGFYTKNSFVMLIPALIILVLPDIPRLSQDRRVRLVLNGVMIAALLTPLVLIYTPLIPTLFPDTIALVGEYILNADFFQTALHSYLLSMGGSLWGTSPILLLALLGAYLLWRDEKRRYVWMMVVAVLGITIGHAISTERNWAGGVSWPPRFIMPAVPLVMVVVLPVLKQLITSKSRWLWAGCGLIAVYSLWWQLSGTLFTWFEYPHALPPEALFISEWSPGLNTVRYMRPAVLTPLWFEIPLDFAWVRLNLLFWPLGLGIFAGYWAWLLARPRVRLRYGVDVLLMVMLLLAVTGLNIISLADDPYYDATNAGLHSISEQIDALEQPGDVVLLNTPGYHRYFLNHRAFDEARMVSLPVPPGERGSFEEAPNVIFDDPAELLYPAAVAQVEALATGRDRLWVLMDTGPFLPWSLRPLERYLTERYFRVREVQSDPPDPRVRLLEYSTRHRIDQLGEPTLTNLQFGDAITLAGVAHLETYVGEGIKPGDVLPLALYWQSTESLDVDYTVALFLVDANGTVVVQGQDTQPAGGFSPTSSWQPEAFIQDNRALRLSDDLPSGRYRVWVRLYANNPDGTLDVLPVMGETVVDGDIGVLPIEFNVEFNVVANGD